MIYWTGLVRMIYWIIFTSEGEEVTLASHLEKISDFWFPVDQLDFRLLSSLTSQWMHGRSAKCFRNNFPEHDWVKLFLKRHPQLSTRFANVKTACATTDKKVIIKYIDNLSTLAKDVPPDNIYNYDETSMSNDPDQSKIICRRGCKYPERIINSTKSNMSVMFCGNAAGSSLPP